MSLPAQLEQRVDRLSMRLLAAGVVDVKVHTNEACGLNYEQRVEQLCDDLELYLDGRRQSVDAVDDRRRLYAVPSVPFERPVGWSS